MNREIMELRTVIKMSDHQRGGAGEWILCSNRYELAYFFKNKFWVWRKSKEEKGVRKSAGRHKHPLYLIWGQRQTRGRTNERSRIRRWPIFWTWKHDLLVHAHVGEENQVTTEDIFRITKVLQVMEKTTHNSDHCYKQKKWDVIKQPRPTWSSKLKENRKVKTITPSTEKPEGSQDKEVDKQSQLKGLWKK